MRGCDQLAACIGTAALLVLGSGAARAHPLAPTLLDLRELGDGRVAVTWKASMLTAPGAEVAPILPAGCRAESAPSAATDGDSVTRTWTLACPSGLVGARIGFSGLDAARIAGLVRIALADGRVVRGVVSGADPVLAVPVRPERGALARTYAWLGCVHLVGGFDAIFFMVGLACLVRGRWRLLETMAALTIGHSLTLSLAGLDLLALPSWPIDLAVAFCVFLLAVELARDPTAPPSWTRRGPWLVALAFGLLQGLSLGSAWRAAAAPAGDAPLALVAFNLGVEAAQLAVFGAVLAAMTALRALRVRWPSWAVQVPLYAMGSLAAFWCLERAAALLH